MHASIAVGLLLAAVVVSSTAPAAAENRIFALDVKNGALPAAHRW
jgi:hypothetical protein